MKDTCPNCGKPMEMYYISYCNTCDAKKIISGKRDSICIIPLFRWMKEHIEGFKEFEDKHNSLRSIIEYANGNDSYYEHYLDINELDPNADEWEETNHTRDQYIKQALDTLGFKIKKNEVFFWISW